MHKFVIPNTVESRKQLGHCIKCQFFKFFKIRVVFEILLNSIVCFFAFSSSYIRVRGIIKVEVFSRFYGNWHFNTMSSCFCDSTVFSEIPRFSEQMPAPLNYFSMRHEVHFTFKLLQISFNWIILPT